MVLAAVFVGGTYSGNASTVWKIRGGGLEITPSWVRMRTVNARGCGCCSLGFVLYPGACIWALWHGCLAFERA